MIPITRTEVSENDWIFEFCHANHEFFISKCSSPFLRNRRGILYRTNSKRLFHILTEYDISGVYDLFKLTKEEVIIHVALENI